MSITSENEHWILCPVCHRPNPVGRTFCKYCWGAALPAEKPVSTQEIAEILEQHKSYLRRRKRSHRIVLASLFALAIAVVALTFNNYTDLLSPPLQTFNSGSLPGDWAMFRHDLSRSGTVPSVEPIPQGTVKWTFAASGPIRSSPAVADGMVYFGSDDGKLYALDAETGAKRWEYLTGSWVESSPAVVGGVVYFGSNDGFLHAVKASTGERLWLFSTFYPIKSSPSIAKQVVYFGSDDYSVYAVDAAKGTKKWEFRTPDPVQSSPVITNGMLYVGSGGDAYALNALTGKMRLDFKTYSPIVASPTAMDGTIFFATSSGNLVALEGNARNWPWEHQLRPLWTQLWVFRLAPRPPVLSGLLWGINLGRKITSTPVLGGDSLYVGSDNNLLSVDIKSRQKRWSFRTEGPVTSSPALSGDLVYVGSEDGRLYAVDKDTGKLAWKVSTDGPVVSSPVVAAGTIYFGSDDGKLYAVK